MLRFLVEPANRCSTGRADRSTGIGPTAVVGAVLIEAQAAADCLLAGPLARTRVKSSAQAGTGRPFVKRPMIGRSAIPLRGR